MHLHIRRDHISRQPGKANRSHTAIARGAYTNAQTRRSWRIANGTQNPQRQMHDRTTRRKCPTPGSNTTIETRNINGTCKSNQKHSKIQKRNIFEHRTDLLRIITLNVRGFKTSEKMKQLKHATDLQRNDLAILTETKLPKHLVKKIHDHSLLKPFTS
jgi:hypothetical protein